MAKRLLDFARPDLPKGTPLVVNGIVYALCKCKVLVMEYDASDGTYLVELFEDFKEPEGWVEKKGTSIRMARHCLFGQGDVPDSWPDDLRAFVDVDPPPEQPEATTDRDLVCEALGLLKKKLGASKKAQDKRKLELLESREKRILAACEDSV